MTLRIAYICGDQSETTGVVGGKRTLGLGGAGEARCGLPARAMTEFSDGEIEAAVFPYSTIAYPGIIQPLDLEGHEAPGRWDVIVLQRSHAREAVAAIKLAQEEGQTVVTDFDDHLWAIHSTNKASTNPHLETYAAIARAADHVTVSTPYLVHVIRALGQPNVTVLPNMIDLRRWQRQPIRQEVHTVGWVGRTSTRSQDLEQLGNAMRYFLREHPKVRFVHGGATSQDPHIADLLSIPRSMVDQRKSIPVKRYPELWRGIDVAICPVNSIPFNAAKSPIKAMEASAAGVPFIASAFGPYLDYTPTGLLASGPAEWKASLELLMDTEQRKTIAERAYAYVEGLDITQQWAKWATFYRDHARTLTADTPRG